MGMGTASVIHHTAIHATVPAMAACAAPKCFNSKNANRPNTGPVMMAMKVFIRGGLYRVQLRVRVTR